MGAPFIGHGRGKAILLGEHAVVHGRPALAASLALGATATGVPADAPRLRIPSWKEDVGEDDDSPLATGLAALYAAMPDAPPLALEVDVELPPGAGLGCSAAIGVALTRALDAARGADDGDEAVAERSLAWERVFHGQPSGVDSAVSAIGGVLRFERGAPSARVVPKHPLLLVIGDTGERAPTKPMVEGVARLHRKDPAKIDQTFDAMAALVRNGILALEAGDLAALGKLMNLAQALLSSLMLSTVKLEEMCAAAREAGAHGAKLTGGGGGGCMIALVDEARADRVRAAVAAAGAGAFVAEAGR